MGGTFPFAFYGTAVEADQRCLLEFTVGKIPIGSNHRLAVGARGRVRKDLAGGCLLDERLLASIGLTEGQAEFVRLLARCIKRGLWFTVVFQPRSGSGERTMTCRHGVKKHRSGGQAAYSFSGKGLIPVWEASKGYRSFGIEAVAELRACGEVVRI